MLTTMALSLLPHFLNQLPKTPFLKKYLKSYISEHAAHHHIHFLEMRFWRRASYTEPLFEADIAAAETSPTDAPTSNKLIPSRSSSTSSSSGGSSLLAQDPMHTSNVIVSLDPTYMTASRSESNEGANEVLRVGDVVVDEDNFEWVVRPCYCASAGCNGQALKRIDGKDELDVWDRGRPRL
jgi:hypothetical protein